MALAGLSELLPDCHDMTEGEPLTIQRLTAWAFRGAGITDPAINDLVRTGLQSPDLETQRLAEAATLKLLALHQEDPRIRASIYATARLAFEAWAEPSVEHSASRKARATYHSDEIWTHKPRFVDLDWLMGEKDDGRANTLYLIAPDTEFKRLAPVLGGLLGDLREQIHAWDIEGHRLAKPLLFVIDEAAQLELQWLPKRSPRSPDSAACSSPAGSPKPRSTTATEPSPTLCSAVTDPRSCSPAATTRPPSTG